MATKFNAAKELKAISQQVTTTQDASEVLDSLDPEGAQVQAPAPGEASKLPGGETLATALAGGVLFGPLFGLAIGGAAHLMQQKEDKSELARMMKDQNAMSASIDLRQESIDEARATTVTPGDEQQVNEMQTQLDAIKLLAANAAPGMQQAATQLLVQHDQGREAYFVRQETDEVARQVRDKADERELGRTNFANYNTMKDDYARDSGPYLGAMLAVELGKKGLTSNNPVMLNIALTMMPKTLDPTSVVQPHEKEIVESALSTIENIWGKLKEGQQITDPQRIQMDQAFDSIAEVQTISQKAIDSRYQIDAIEDLLPKYAGRFNLAGQRAPMEKLIIPGVNDEATLNPPIDENTGRPRVPGLIELLEPGPAPEGVTRKPRVRGLIDFLAPALPTN